jgi:AbrB-like transcriptional regulator
MPTKTKAPVMEAPVIEEQFEPETEGEDNAIAVLIGEQLLAFYTEKAEEGMAQNDIAYKAGYFSVTKKGALRINVTQFHEALLAAKGVPVAKKKSVTGRGRGSAGLTRARVSGTGMLLVSQLAVREVGAEPGAIFQVSFPAEGQILLTNTGEIVPITPRGKASGEELGTPLLDELEEGGEA